MSLGTFIGDQKATGWFDFHDGFELCIRYCPKKELSRLGKKFKSLSDEEQDIATTKLFVIDWRGLTPRRLMGFCVVGKVNKAELDVEYPFSEEDLDELVRKTYDTDDLDKNISHFTIKRATNASLFKPQRGKEGKNL